MANAYDALLAQYYTPADRRQSFFDSLAPLGAGLIAAGAPTTNPAGFSQGISQGLLGMQQTMRQGQQDALQRAAMMAKLNEPIKLSAGEAVYDRSGRLLMQGPERGPQTDLGKLLAEINRLAPNDPNRRLYEQQLAMLGQKDGFRFRQGADGALVAEPVAGGPADPRYVGQKAGAAASAEAPFKVVPWTAGGGVATGRDLGFGGGPAVPPPSASPPSDAPRLLNPTPMPQFPGQPSAPSRSSDAPSLPPRLGEAPPPDMPRTGTGVRNPIDSGLQRLPGGGFAAPSPTETEFDKSYGKGSAEQALALEAAGSKARAQADNYRRFLIYQEMVKTGRLAPAATEAAAYAQAFGIDPRTLGLDKAGPAEALDAIANELARGNIGGEGGMPAANFSNADREFVVSSEPRLSATPEGNRLRAEAKLLVADRNAAQAEAWLEYRDSGKTWLEFQRDWRAYVRKNPVFDDAFRARVAEIVGAPDKPRATQQVAPAPAQTDAPVRRATPRYRMTPDKSAPGGFRRELITE
jgi:hypothetical protein